MQKTKGSMTHLTQTSCSQTCSRLDKIYTKDHLTQNKGTCNASLLHAAEYTWIDAVMQTSAHLLSMKTAHQEPGLPSAAAAPTCSGLPDVVQLRLDTAHGEPEHELAIHQSTMVHDERPPARSRTPNNIVF